LTVCFALPPAGINAAQLMDIDGMSVIGNSELPKALFIVPWKDADAAAAPDRPINTLVDSALEPVDPEVFRRTLQYYDAVHTH
jgi:hypothetical protein